MKRFVFIGVLLSCFFLFAAESKSKLAVMEIEDISNTLDESVLSKAAEYLRGEFVNSGSFIVIAKERQEKEMIKQLKKESHALCKDKKCQIPLGQALSADTILRTNINHFGGVYTINTEMVDLAKEATVKGAQFKFDGTEKGLRESIDKIVARMTGKKEMVFKKQKIVAPKKKIKKQTVKPIKKIRAKERKWSKKSINKMSWSSSKDYCEELREGGFSDWRLPDISELRETVKGCKNIEKDGKCAVTNECKSTDNCRNSYCDGCPDKSDGSYSIFGDKETFWSSTEISRSGSKSWFIDFSTGEIESSYRVKKRYVRCKR